uniref:Uncharacterized protein n=1 Tax=Arundo donax TaxID=35708 RepID=A0A0A9FLT8_ARUDO
MSHQTVHKYRHEYYCQTCRFNRNQGNQDTKIHNDFFSKEKYDLFIYKEKHVINGQDINQATILKTYTSSFMASR